MSQKSKTQKKNYKKTQNETKPKKTPQNVRKLKPQISKSENVTKVYN